MHMVFDIMDIKFLVKFSANRLNPFVVIKEHKKNFTTFPHILASRAKRDITRLVMFLTQGGCVMM